MSGIISKDIDSCIFKEKIVVGDWSSIKYRFHILKNINYKKNKNLISASIFKLPIVDEVYANQKNMTIEELSKEHKNKTIGYINGLNNIITKTKDMNIRIYCDNTSIRIVEKYLEYNNVEIVYYFFEQFFNFDMNCHYGFFGTLMRYIPLFNFEYFDNKWDTVTVIDLENNFLNIRKLMNNFIKMNSKVNLIFWSRPCYYLSPRIFSMEHDLKKFSIISSFLMQKKQQDCRIFKLFLIDLLNGEEIYDKTLRQYLRVDFDGRYFNGRLEYGVDEYFINYHFFNKCYIIKNLPFYVVFSREVSGGFLEWIKNIRFSIPKRIISNEVVTNRFLDIIVKNFFPKDTTIPDGDINERILWVAETYYKLNLQFIQRRIDQTLEIVEFYNSLLDNDFKDLDLYEDFIFGLGFNVLLKSNFYTAFLVNPNGKYPEIRRELVWSVQKM